MKNSILLDGNATAKVFERIAILGASLLIIVQALNIISLTLYCAIIFICAVGLWVFSPKRLKFELSMQSIALAYFVGWCFLSSVYSYDRTRSLMYCLIIIISVLFYCCLSKSDRWIPFWEKLLMIIAVLNTAITIFSSLNFDLFSDIFGRIMKEDAMLFAAHAVNRGQYSGIMGQTGTNAYTIIPLVIITLCNLRNNKKNPVNWILLILGIWALFLTQKRGALVWLAVSFLTVYWLRMRKNKSGRLFRIIKLLALVLLIVLVIGIAYDKSVTVQAYFDRFVEQEDSDVSTGRLGLYRQAVESMIGYPLGIGIDAYSSVYGENVHNELLQFGAEIGLLGLAFLCVFFFCLLRKTVRGYMSCAEETVNRFEIVLSMLFYQLYSSLTSFPLHHYGMCIQFFVIMAAAVSLSDCHGKEVQNEVWNRNIQ